MKFMKITTILLALLTFVTFSFATNGEDGKKLSYNINLEKSTVEWEGSKVTGSHNGLIQLKEGKLEFDGDLLIGGNFVMDMNSITCSDLEGKWSDKIVDHLKSDDFFGVEKHPTASLEITKVVAHGAQGNYKITGNITIKETTKEIHFNTTIKEEGADKRAFAEITLDRTDFGIRYGSGSFFDNLGDKTIHDEFGLKIKLAFGE